MFRLFKFFFSFPIISGMLKALMFLLKLVGKLFKLLLTILGIAFLIKIIGSIFDFGKTTPVSEKR